MPICAIEMRLNCLSVNVAFRTSCSRGVVCHCRSIDAHRSRAARRDLKIRVKFKGTVQESCTRASQGYRSISATRACHEIENCPRRIACCFSLPSLPAKIKRLRFTRPPRVLCKSDLRAVSRRSDTWRNSSVSERFISPTGRLYDHVLACG